MHFTGLVLNFIKNIFTIPSHITNWHPAVSQQPQETQLQQLASVSGTTQSLHPPSSFHVLQTSTNQKSTTGILGLLQRNLWLYIASQSKATSCMGNKVASSTAHLATWERLESKGEGYDQWLFFITWKLKGVCVGREQLYLSFSQWCASEKTLGPPTLAAIQNGGKSLRGVVWGGLFFFSALPTTRLIRFRWLKGSKTAPTLHLILSLLSSCANTNN